MSTLRYGYNFGMTKRLANAFGKGRFTEINGSLCCAAQDEGEMATAGYRFNCWDTLNQARLIINWGHNPAQTYHAHWYIIADALESGARMVTIDPRYSDSAAKSDRWVGVLPSTDLALSMGMINIIIQEELYDKAFVLNRTNLPFLVNEATGKLLRPSQVGLPGNKNDFLVWDSSAKSPVGSTTIAEPALEGTFEINGTTVRTVFDRLKERASRYTAKKVAELCSIKADQVTELAHDYATIKPACINSIMSGSQRTSWGEYLVASFVTLAALTGNLGIPGGGLNDLGGPLVHGTLNAAELMAPHEVDKVGVIPMSKLGECLCEGKPYPIKGVYWQGAGAGQFPNSSKVMQGLKSTEFVVVIDNFYTDAASVADVILPAASSFEYVDLMASHVNEYYQLIDKVIDPLWECKSDPQIMCELAQRLGFVDDFNYTDEEWVDYALKGTGLSVDILRKRGPVWLWSDEKLNAYGVKRNPGDFVFFRDTPIKTPSGRIEIHSTRWEDAGLEPMIDYFPPKEGTEKTPDLAAKYPLHLANAKVRTKIHSSFALMPWMSEIYADGWVEINPVDAATREISDGDSVEVFNDRGSITVRAAVGPSVRDGVVMLPNGWWIQQGCNANILTNDEPSAINNGQTNNTTLVEVRRA